MNHYVNINTTINNIFKNQNGIYKYFKEFGRYNYLIDYCDCRYHRRYHKHSASLLRQLISNDMLYENPLHRILFQAFLYAEIRFTTNYIPQNSHEERLTGHLISEINSALEIVKETYHNSAKEFYGTDDIHLNFHYTDLSANKQEKITGADMAIILHNNLPDYESYTKVAIIQAKKFDKSMRIDTEQFRTLNSFAGGCGYYCGYDMNNDDLYPPMILKLGSIENIIKRCNQTKGINKNSEELLNRTEKNDPIKSISIKRKLLLDENYAPLSIFLIFDLLYSDKNKFDTLREAKHFILRGQTNDDIESIAVSLSENIAEKFSPSKIMTISLGGTNNDPSLESKELSQLFSNEYKKYVDEE